MSLLWQIRDRENYFFEGAVPFILADWVREQVRGAVVEGLEPSRPNHDS